MTIGDATKTLASRIWDTWIPFGSESETEVTTVASCRIPLADILAAGKRALLPSNTALSVQDLGSERLKCMRCIPAQAVKCHHAL